VPHLAAPFGRRARCLSAAALSLVLLAATPRPDAAHASIGPSRDSIGPSRDSIGPSRDSIGRGPARPDRGSR